MNMDNKYKSGALIFNEQGKMLLVVGEERNSAGKKLLLTPGGTVQKEKEPDEWQYLETLLKELEEEITLNINDYEISQKNYMTTAKASTSDDVIIMKLYKVDLNDGVNPIPNFIEGNPDHDVEEAVWIGPENFIIDGTKLRLKEGSTIEVINKDGKRNQTTVDDYEITDLTTDSVIPEIMADYPEWQIKDNNLPVA